MARRRCEIAHPPALRDLGTNQPAATVILDLRTIFVVGAVTSIVLGIVQLVAFATGRFERWPLWWGLSNILVGLGTMGVAARGLVPDVASIQIANLTGWAGYLLLLVGVRSFAGRAQKAAHYVAAIVVAAALMTWWEGPDDFLNRVVLMALLCAACDLLIIREAVRLAQRERLASAWMMSGLFAMTAAMFVSRAVFALNGELGTELFPPRGSVDTMLVLVGTAFLVLRGITLLLLAAERSGKVLTALALHDPLTGVMNRCGLEGSVSRFAQDRAGTRASVAVLLIDLDNFKQLNDGYGHATGDRILRLFAKAAHSQLRATDVLARQGGDEFVVVLPDLKVREATLIAERIRAAFSEAVSALGDLSARPTLSIGVAEGRLSEMSLDAIIVSADESLYLAKRAGRDRVHGTPASEVLETA